MPELIINFNSILLTLIAKVQQNNVPISLELKQEIFKNLHDIMLELSDQSSIISTHGYGDLLKILALLQPKNRFYIIDQILHKVIIPKLNFSQFNALIELLYNDFVTIHKVVYQLVLRKIIDPEEILQEKLSQCILHALAAIKEISYEVLEKLLEYRDISSWVLECIVINRNNDSIMLEKILNHPKILPYILIAIVNHHKTSIKLLGKILYHPKSDPSVLIAIVNSDKISQSWLEKILNHHQTDCNVLLAIVVHKRISIQLLEKILNHPKTEANILRNLTKHKKISMKFLYKILNHPKTDSYVLKTIVNHKKTDTNLLEAILNHPKTDPYVLQGIAAKQKNTVALLEKILNHHETNPYVLKSIAINPKTTPELLNKILDHFKSDQYVLEGISINPQATINLLKKILKHPKTETYVITSIVKHKNISSEILADLVKYPNINLTILEYIAFNPKVTLKVLKKILEKFNDQPQKILAMRTYKNQQYRFTLNQINQLCEIFFIPFRNNNHSPIFNEYKDLFKDVFSNRIVPLLLGENLIEWNLEPNPREQKIENLVKAKIKHLENIVYKMNHIGLINLIKARDITKIKEFCCDRKKINLNYQDQTGETILMQAIATQNETIIKFLLKIGGKIDLSLENYKGETVVTQVIASQNEVILQMLLELPEMIDFISKDQNEALTSINKMLQFHKSFDFRSNICTTFELPSKNISILNQTNSSPVFPPLELSKLDHNLTSKLFPG